MIEVIKGFGNVASSIMTIVALLTLLIKPVRKGLVNWIERLVSKKETDRLLNEVREMLINQEETNRSQQAMLTLQSNALLCLLRSNISARYHKYLPNREIPNYELKNVVQMYECYCAMHGNSYVEVIYNEIRKFKIIPD